MRLLFCPIVAFAPVCWPQGVATYVLRLARPSRAGKPRKKAVTSRSSNAKERGMRIGVPKEIKVLENRVGLTPESVREIVSHGHEVLVEHNAGQGIGMDDAAYRRAGA